MTIPEVTEPAAVDDQHADHRRELIKEASTMALYVSVCLLAALAVAGEADVAYRPTIIAVVWGTTLGLAIAHWFAFRLSARLTSAGEVRRTDAEVSVAQLAGSVIVALVATVPVVLFDGSDAQLEATNWFVVGFIAVIGYLVGRSSGASKVRSVVYAGAVVVAAALVVIVKNALSGH